jgi:hypothetical protein
MIKIVTFIVIFFSAAALLFILYSAVGNATSLTLVDHQSGKYLDKQNVNSYGVLVPFDTGIFQYENIYTSSCII